MAFVLAIAFHVSEYNRFISVVPSDKIFNNSLHNNCHPILDSCLFAREKCITITQIYSNSAMMHRSKELGGHHDYYIKEEQFVGLFSQRKRESGRRGGQTTSDRSPRTTDETRTKLAIYCPTPSPFVFVH